MVERKLDGSYLLTLYREWIKSIRKKNEFLKNIYKNCIKMIKIFNFFKIDFWPKKKHLRDAAQPKKKVFEKHRQGGHKKGLRKRDGKKMVMDGLSL